MCNHCEIDQLTLSALVRKCMRRFPISIDKITEKSFIKCRARVDSTFSLLVILVVIKQETKGAEFVVEFKLFNYGKVSQDPKILFHSLKMAKP